MCNVIKFRAVMVDADSMREFSNVVSTISKLSKECVLRVTDDQLYFIVSEENSGPTAPILWCEIPQSMFFTEYQMCGSDEEHRNIYLEIASGSLARSLVVLESAKSLKMKLTKKQCPCLTLEIKMPSINSEESSQVTHDIPVTVIPRQMWSNFIEPRIPNPDISIELPPLKQMQTTIDRMRTMASEVVVRASVEGRLTLEIKTDMAKVSTRFRGLRVDGFGDPIENSESEAESEVEVNIKKLSIFLSAEQMSHKSMIFCSIVCKKFLILCLQTEKNVKFQSYISGIVY